MPQDPIFWKNVEKFIGREENLESLLHRLRGPGFHLVSVSGGYGYGKTRLLDRLLERAKNPRPAAALPSVKIDLYESKHHTPGGLAHAIVDCFKDHAEYFQEYEKLRIEHEDAKVAGNVDKAQHTFWEMLDACIGGLSSLSQQHGLLLLLDTAERWIYPNLDDSPFPTTFAPAWEWVRDKVCPKLKRGLVILAGRPEIGRLGLDAKNRIKLEPFTLEETEEYIQGTCDRFQKQLNREPPHFSQQEIHRLRALSQGRPILLALFLELIAHGDQRISGEAFSSEPVNFEQFLVQHLMQSPSLGELLRAVGRAPKGVDSELLAKMTGYTQEELEPEFEQLKGLSFVKTFEGNPRLFFHEEMYAILGRHVYDDLDADLVEARQAAQGIHAYYKHHTSQLNIDIGKLYTGYASENDESKKKQLARDIDEKTNQLETLNVDFAYYRWRYKSKMDVAEDPIDMGLRRYYRLAHEAATSNEVNLLVLLRAELIDFIHDLENQEDKGRPQPWLHFLKGFAHLQRALEKTAMGKDYKNLAEQINSEMLPALEKIENLSLEQKKVLGSLLTAWRGHVLMYAGEPDYETARKHFEQVIQNLKGWPDTSELRWLAHAALVFVYRQRAFLLKRQGLFKKAIQNYKAALEANRGQDFNFEEAMIRNDLGDTQVLIGDFKNASLNLDDALKLRMKMKSGARLALSYSTLSRYHNAHRGYHDALIFAERGKNLAFVVGRNTALARIALAEAIRRHSRQEIAEDNNKQKQRMDEAEKLIKEAIEGLKRRGEPALLVEAYLELGCIYRDRVRLYERDEDGNQDFANANEYLKKVSNMSMKRNSSIPYRAADAMSNRIWLGLFAADSEFTQHSATEFEQLPLWKFNIFPKGNFLRAKKMAKSDQRLLVQFIGKYHIAMGTHALGRDKRITPENAEEVAWRWMLGLEYSRLFASEFRGLAAARQTIYKDLNKFNPEELSRLSKAVSAAQAVEGLKTSLLKQLMQDNSLWFDKPKETTP